MVRLDIKIFVDEMHWTKYTSQNQFLDFFSDKEDWKMYILNLNPHFPLAAISFYSSLSSFLILKL